MSGLEGRLTLSAGGNGQMPDTVSYQVAGALDVPPGRYQLRVSATSAKLAKGGSVYLNVDVPDFSATPLALSGLAVGYAAGPRVPVAPMPAAQAGPSGSLLPFPPSLDREFAASDALRLYFEIASRAPLVAPKATVEVESVAGHSRHAINPELAPGDRDVDVQVPLTGLAPGAYVLRVTVTDQGRSASREIGFVIK